MRTSDDPPFVEMSSDQVGRHADMHAGRRYGLLGGTFDPPHLGHLVLAQEVYARLGLDRVWFVPTGTPPHKAGHHISAGADRLAMVELAVAGDPRFAVCDVELARSGPSYTADTLGVVRERWGETVHLTLILGWDMLAFLPHWHAPERVVGQVDALAAVHRPGFVADETELQRLEAALPGLRDKLIVLPAPQLDLAATDLRSRLASGLPIRYLVPDAVCQYIEQRGLYRPGAVVANGGLPSEVR